jgi:hypothetical protein
MNPSVRRFIYTLHLSTSIGWLGAVLTFLAVAAIGLTSSDEAVVRGAYLVMAPAAWLVLVPLAHASLVSGVVLSLGTAWGLFRHHWVVLKLLIMVFSTVILLIYMSTFREMSGLAADPLADLSDVRNPSPVVHAILALILLVGATVLGVYKPFGMIFYGRANQGTPLLGVLETAAGGTVWARSGYVASWVVVGIVLLLALVHWMRTGFQH